MCPCRNFSFNEPEECIVQRKISFLPEKSFRLFKSLTNKRHKVLVKLVPKSYLQPNFPQLLCQQKNHDQEDCMELAQCQAPYMHKVSRLKRAFSCFRIRKNFPYCSSHSKEIIVLETQERIGKKGRDF